MTRCSRQGRPLVSRVALLFVVGLSTLFATGPFPDTTPARAGEVTARICPGESAPRFPGRFLDLGGRAWLDQVSGCHAAGNGVAGLYQDRDGEAARFGQSGKIVWEAPTGVLITAATGTVRMRDVNGFRGSVIGTAGGVDRKIFDGSMLDGAAGTFSWPGTGSTATSIALAISCDRSDGCPNRRDSVKSFVQVDRLEITGRDPSPPSVSHTGEVAELSARGAWARGLQGWSAFASDDGTGVADLYFLVNGFPLQVPRIGCRGIIDGQATDLAPCPETRFQSGSFDTSKPPFREGLNSVRLCAADFATDPARANRGCSARSELRIDGSPPSAPLDLETDRGPAWSARGDFTVSWSLPEDQGSPLDEAFYRLRDFSDGRVVEAGTMPAEAGEAGGMRELAIAEPGDYRLEFGLTDAAGNSGPVATTPVRFDDRPPPDVVPTPRPGWVSRAELPLAQTVGPTPDPGPSGIAGFALSSSDLGPTSPCRGRSCRLSELSWLGGPFDGHAMIDGLAEGENTISAVAVSGAWIPSRNPGTATVRVDLTDPVVRVTGSRAKGEGPSGWSNGPVTVTATATDALSGMVPDPDDTDFPVTGIGIAGSELEAEAGDRSSITVTREGVTEIEYFARDLAGNSTRRTGDGSKTRDRTVVRIDSVPPEVEILPPGDASDPERVIAMVDDPASGLADGEISIGPKGGRADFRTLATTISPGRLEARIPSDEMPPGDYVLEAEATDLAGNRTVVTSEFHVRLPLKAPTSLFLREAGRSTAGRVIAGRVVAGSGVPSSGMPVTIEEVFPPGSGIPNRKTSVQVGVDGSFSVELPAGPSRKARATFEGDRASRRASSRWISLASADRVRFSVRDRVTRNLALTRMVGSVSGPGMGIPQRGKKVVIQYFDPSRRAWRPVEVVTSRPSGRFTFVYRFRTISSRQRILFRAKSLGEVGWPFVASASRPIAVVVLP